MRRLRLIGLVVGVVVLGLGVFAPAGSAKTGKCMVINDRLNTTYAWTTADGHPVQTAIDAASPGDTLWIRGSCPGPVEITKSLTLTGQTINGFVFAPTIMNDVYANTSVVHVSGSDVQVQLNSLTLTGGGDRNHPVEHGGGIWNEQSTLTLNNVTITKNTALNGGGIYNDHGTVELTNSTIDLNFLARGVHYGGGIYTYGGTVTVNASTITNNMLAYRGGGIYAIASTVVANGSEIANNKIGGTAVPWMGGGIYASRDESYPNQIGSTVTLTDTTIHDNDANHGGGVFVGAYSTLTLTGTSELYSNHASGDGGGAFGTVIVSGDATIHDNTAGDSGGGVWGPATLSGNAEIYGNTSVYGGGVNGNNITLSDNAQIHGNTASQRGGGIYGNTITMSDNAQIYENTSVNGRGGGIYTQGTITMSGNAQIHDNTATQGGGIYSYYASHLSGCQAGNAGDAGVNVFDNAPDDIYTSVP